MVNTTNRETDVIKLLVEGKTNCEIGKELFISAHTVKKILENLFEKTRSRNRVQVAVYAIKNNIIK